MANQPKKYKKFVATAATATLVASAIVPVASAKSFSDVPANNEFEPFIDALSDAGIINGYADGTFKPGAKLTRGQVVKMLGRWVEANGAEVPADWNSKQRFNDVPVNGSDSELVKYAALVKDAGVFTGSNGNLLAGNNITRQQMAKVLNGAYKAVNGVSLVDLADSVDNKLIADLANSQPEFEGYIQALVDLEISTVSVFRPSENVTRAQFAKFLYNTINLETVATAGVKAINATTVEVTFDEEVADIKALDFKIEGLEVSNAVVKQTDKKTVVLTTSPQTAGVEYTVTVNGEAVGTFTGISAVIPTKVELVTSSVQGKLGQQVTVQAKVTVPEGQSKAGIPVTFSIPGNNNDAVNPTVTGEAFTNADGIATYTYTRYTAKTDAVTAYATGDRSKFAVGYVFWGADTIVAITEVTEGATINNGANKTYKITYKDPETGKPKAGQTFNVSALENINVTSDKLQNITINGVKVAQLSNSTVTLAAQITTDSKGEATFTVSGTNAEVTPVVYAANNTKDTSGATVYDYKYDASDLQATAAKVKFTAVQAEYTIELTREGGEVAALGAATGGRQYKVIVKDKDGKVAKNEVVNVAFNEDLDRVISTNTEAKFVDTKDDKDDNNDVYYSNTPVNGMSAKQIFVKTNDKGEATFVIGSDKENDYATPIAWIDINSSNAKDATLDEGEPKAVAPISYFQKAYLDGSAIKAYKSGKAETKFDGTDTAVFDAELVNQSGKKIAGTSVKKVTYTVYNTGANDIKVDGRDDQVVSPNRSITVTKEAPSDTKLYVTSVDGKTTAVKVIATGIGLNTDGKEYAFTAKEAEITFTSTKEVSNNYTGEIEAIDTVNEKLTFKGKNAVSIKDAKFFGQNGAEIANFEAFVTELKAVGGAVATYLKDSEGKVTVKIVRTGGSLSTIKFDEKSATLTNAAITKQPVTATPSTPATATVAFTDIDAAGDEFKVNGLTYKFAAGALPTEAGYYKDAADLATKITAAGKDVTATVDGSGDIALTGKADGSDFVYTVNGTDTTVNNGTKGVVGNYQQLTLTFSSALNVVAGDAVSLNGTTATVKSVDGNKIVIELDASATPLVGGATVTALTVGTNNAIVVPTGTDAIVIGNAF